MDRPDLRASDAERDRAVELLRDAAAEGRLTFEELADRIEVAGAATTRGELELLTADLPVPAVAAPPPSDAPVKHSSVFGDVKRSGTWAVPERSKWGSVFGDVVLDLREAHVAAPQVMIDAGSIFGDVKVRARRLRERLAQRLLGGQAR